MDNRNWDFPSSEAVIPTGALHVDFDVKRAAAAHVIRVDDTYQMLYWGSDANGLNTILRCETPIDEPNNWRPMGGPLIGPQPETEHNCNGPGFPFLLPLTPEYHLLYFTGWGRWIDGKVPNTTGVAISKDGGETWRYDINHPVIPLDRSYDAEGTGSVWVLYEDGRFRMYYTAIGKYLPKPEGVITGHGDVIPHIGIAYAESADGIHWEKPFDELVVSPRGFDVSPYEYICSKPCIIKEDDGYIMWVNTFGSAYRVHRLYSEDGLSWEWAKRIGPDGEFGVGQGGAFDDHQRSYPTVIEHDGELRCWFTGNSFGATGMGYATRSSHR